MDLTRSTPAILGGAPRFDPPLPFVRPTIEDADGIIASVRGSLDSGQLTDGATVRILEEEAAAAFGVEHCVAVASGTVGLMLVVQAIEPSGPVLVPSFTFSATAHAVAWNGVPIVFADCDPATWCLRPDDIRGAPDLIIGVHVAGVPCDVDGLAAAANRLGASLMFDAAHGSGTLVVSQGRATPVGGFGIAEVFSLTPTKVLSGVEGGLVTTNDGDLAQRLRIARNYGNPGSYDTLFPGLNARMSELHAAVALASLRNLDRRVTHRNQVAAWYKHRLASMPGLTFQTIPVGARSSMKDLSILVDPNEFGCGAEAVVAGLAADGVPTRRYFSPPVHRQTAYRHIETGDLPATDLIASRVVSLPIWSHMDEGTVEAVCEVLAGIHARAPEVSERLAGP